MANSVNSRSAYILLGLALIQLFIVILVRDHYIDEGWLAEYAYWMSQTGKVKSYLFGDLLHYNQQLLVYHKLFIVLSALVVKIFGFGIQQLRFFNLFWILGLITLVFKFSSSKLNLSKGLALLSCILIILNAITIKFGSIFRPEHMIAFFGFSSFYFFINSQTSKKSHPNSYLYLSAFFAGLAALTHLNGIIYIVTPCLILLIQRNWIATFKYALITAAVCLLFFWDINPKNFELFINQFFNDPALIKNVSSSWFHSQILNEHRRFFHDLSTSILTILFIVGSFTFKRNKHNKTHQLTHIYSLILVGLFIVLVPKNTPIYLILIFPFISIVVLQIWGSKYSEYGKLIKYLLITSLVVFSFSGFYEGYRQVKKSKDFVEQNHYIASFIPKNKKVIAPLSFVFNELPDYRIKSLYYYRYLAWDYNNLNGLNRSQFLFQDAASHMVDYIVIKRTEIAPIKIEDLKKTYCCYTMIYGDNDWLLFKKHYKNSTL